MSRNDFGKRNTISVMLSDKDKLKLKLMAEDDEKSLSEWLREQVTLAYFVRYEQFVVDETIRNNNQKEMI